MMKFFIYFLLFSTPSISFCQTKNQCAEIHDGLFYYYPKNANGQFVSYRNGNLLKEVEIGKTDTSFWSVKWLDACSYEVKFQSGGSVKQADKQFLKEHNFCLSYNRYRKGLLHDGRIYR